MTPTKPGRLAGRLIPASIVLLAAVLRFWDLGVVPPGFQFDEAHNAIDAARVLAGDFQLFFTENGGREPLVTYLHAASLGLLGREHVVFALRLVSAFIGVTTVAVLYGFGVRFFGRKRPAALGAAFLAVSYWHMHFSRFAIRAVLAPLWTTAVLWAWWVAIGGAPDDVEGDHKVRGNVAHGEDGQAIGGAPDDAAGDHEERGNVAHGEEVQDHGAKAPQLPPDAAGRPVWRADRRRIGAAIGCGVALAVAVYSHPSGRLLPLVLLAHVVVRSIAARAAARDAWRALAIVGVTAFLVFLPLAGYFAQHPGQFTSHPSDVSLTAVAEADHDGNLVRALAANLGAAAGMLFVRGDPSTFHNLPDLPVFDPLSALLAVIGIGVVLGWLTGSHAGRRDRAVLMVLWVVVGLLPTLLSDRPPNYSRAMAALPVIVLLPAIGLTWAIGPLRRRQAVHGVSLAVVVIAVGALWTTFHHFVAFRQLGQVYYSYDVEKVDLYEALAELSNGAAVYLHPLWSGHATIRFLDEERRLTPLDGRDTVVLPADGRSAVIAFPAREGDRQGWIDQSRTLLGGAGEYVLLTDAKGAPLAYTVRVSRDAIGDLVPPTDAPLEPAVFDGTLFDAGIELVGYTVGRAVPGEPLSLVLVWRALALVSRDLTVFTHLVAADGASLGQMDREPAHASYRTSQWATGDVIVDRFAPDLSTDAIGTVSVRLGWYDRETGERLRTDDGSDAITIGPIPVASSRP